MLVLAVRRRRGWSRSGGRDEAAATAAAPRASPTTRSSSAAATRSPAGVGVRRASAGGQGALRGWVNAKGGVNGRKIEFVTSTTATTRRAVTNARRLVDPGQGVRAVQHARHRQQPGDLGLRQPAEGPARVRRHRRVGLGRGRRGAPVDDRLAARLRDRGEDLRRVPQEGEAERARSRSCTRTTASARTCWAASRRRSRAPRSRSSRARATRSPTRRSRRRWPSSPAPAPTRS